MTQMPGQKGAVLEELLRDYFLEMGAFALRGVKLQHLDLDITDVDLWVYVRTSQITRERINVDVKNKRNPQVLERVLWARGLQQVLGTDRCFVATTDNNPSIPSFAHKHRVGLLGGKFVNSLKDKANRIVSKRLSEEQFRQILGDKEAKRKDPRVKIYDAARTRFLGSMNFDTCNWLLEQLRAGLEVAITKGPPLPESDWRLVYLCLSLLAITLDSITVEQTHLGPEELSKLLAEGFRYGQGGARLSKRVTQLVVHLVSSVSLAGSLGETLLQELNRQTASFAVETLSDPIAYTSIGVRLFEMALAFERAAYSVDFPAPSQLDNECQAFLGVVSDFWSLDRKRTLV